MALQKNTLMRKSQVILLTSPSKFAHRMNIILLILDSQNIDSQGTTGFTGTQAVPTQVHLTGPETKQKIRDIFKSIYFKV